MQSTATTPDEYIAALPADRKTAIQTVRKVLIKNLPAGFEEGMLYGMISYFIPLERYPDTYNKQPLTIVSLASQKNYMALYLMGVYSGGEQAFRNAYKATGKRLDMGKSCVRFKTLDDLPLELIAQTVASVSPKKFIEIYESSRAK